MSPLILVVDDELDARETIRDLLEYEGYAVETAANGREALERIAALGDRRCVVLLDLFMPVMSGWELVERLGADPPPTVKVLITTSAPEQAPRGFPVLGKPLDADKLLALVRKHG